MSEFQALPDLDAGANAVAFQHIRLENEGWDRDTTIQEPVEVSLQGLSARQGSKWLLNDQERPNRLRSRLASNKKRCQAVNQAPGSFAPMVLNA